MNYKDGSYIKKEGNGIGYTYNNPPDSGICLKKHLLFGIIFIFTPN